MAGIKAKMNSTQHATDSMDVRSQSQGQGQGHNNRESEGQSSVPRLGRDRDRDTTPPGQRGSRERAIPARYSRDVGQRRN